MDEAELDQDGPEPPPELTLRAQRLVELFGGDEPLPHEELTELDAHLPRDHRRMAAAAVKTRRMGAERERAGEKATFTSFRGIPRAFAPGDSLPCELLGPGPPVQGEN
jgi:hypothetical protein